MPSASLWASVPHYVAAAPNPKAALALVRKLECAGRRGRRRRASSRPPPADYERQVGARGAERPRRAGVRRAARAGGRRGGASDADPTDAALGRRASRASSSASCASAGPRGPTSRGTEELVAVLARAGFVAADEEAEELRAAAGDDAELLDALVARRLTGEPLAWITGSVEFCGRGSPSIPGVYVPRWQSELLAVRAVERLPPTARPSTSAPAAGRSRRSWRPTRPGARVVATDVDARAVACARRNGVEAYSRRPLRAAAAGARGRVDVVVGVVPYVPTRRSVVAAARHLHLRDAAGLRRRRRTAARSCAGRWPTGAARPAPGGALLLELGGQQADAAPPRARAAGFVDVAVLRDEDGDVRGIEATRPSRR